jgi:hypothetical protein
MSLQSPHPSIYDHTPLGFGIYALHLKRRLMIALHTKPISNHLRGQLQCFEFPQDLFLYVVWCVGRKPVVS